jgi:hypothetical protein
MVVVILGWLPKREPSGFYESPEVFSFSNGISGVNILCLVKRGLGDQRDLVSKICVPVLAV